MGVIGKIRPLGTAHAGIGRRSFAVLMNHGSHRRHLNRRTRGCRHCFPRARKSRPFRIRLIYIWAYVHGFQDGPYRLSQENGRRKVWCLEGVVSSDGIA